MIQLIFLMICVIFGIIVYLSGALDLLGSSFVTIIGMFIVITRGFNWLTILLLFLFLGSVFTKFKSDYKRRIGLKHEQRTVKNVVSNGIVPVVMALPLRSRVTFCFAAIVTYAESLTSESITIVVAVPSVGAAATALASVAYSVSPIFATFAPHALPAHAKATSRAANFAVNEPIMFFSFIFSLPFSTSKEYRSNGCQRHKKHGAAWCKPRRFSRKSRDLFCLPTRNSSTTMNFAFFFVKKRAHYTIDA